MNYKNLRNIFITFIALCSIAPTCLSASLNIHKKLSIKIEGHTVAIWDTETGECINTINQTSLYTSFSRDGTKVADFIKTLSNPYEMMLNFEQNLLLYSVLNRRHIHSSKVEELRPIYDSLPEKLKIKVDGVNPAWRHFTVDDVLSLTPEYSFSFIG